MAVAEMPAISAYSYTSNTVDPLATSGMFGSSQQLNQAEDELGQSLFNVLRSTVDPRLRHILRWLRSRLYSGRLFHIRSDLRDYCDPGLAALSLDRGTP